MSVNSKISDYPLPITHYLLPIPMNHEQTPQRILMTTDTIGGVWTYSLELAEQLTKNRVKIALATMGKPLSSTQWQATQKIPHLQVFESHYKLEWMDDPWEDVAQAGTWLLHLAQQWQPDLVHLNGYVHAALPWPVPAVVVGHSCVLSWWEAVKQESAPASWHQYFQQVRRGLQAAEVVIAPSQAMLAALERFYGNFKKSEVIYNGRDSRRYQVTEKEDFVLSAGRLWDEAKNVAALEAVANRLGWPVFVAGEGYQEVGSGVVGLGRLSAETLAQWYSRASIYALPARYEPFGLSVLEAALSGCALVLGDISSLREIWGEAALYVPSEDHEALVTAINGLAADEPRRCRLAQKARLRGLELSPQQMGQNYLAVYQELLSLKSKQVL